jgi:hypothetical protein
VDQERDGVTIVTPGNLVTPINISGETLSHRDLAGAALDDRHPLIRCVYRTRVMTGGNPAAVW